ncbi:hypothetical protein YC2023_099691 [Brassica napus]
MTMNELLFDSIMVMISRTQVFSFSGESIVHKVQKEQLKQISTLQAHCMKEFVEYKHIHFIKKWIDICDIHNARTRKILVGLLLTHRFLCHPTNPNPIASLVLAHVPDQLQPQGVPDPRRTQHHLASSSRSRQQASRSHRTIKPLGIRQQTDRVSDQPLATSASITFATR